MIFFEKSPEKRPEKSHAPLDERQRPGAGVLVLIFGICLALSALAYLPGIRGEFLNFDDDRVAMRPISVPVGSEGEARYAFQDNVLASLGTILNPSRTIAEVYYPVTTLSYYLDWKLWHRPGKYRGMEVGQNSLAYHLHNLLLHAIVGFLLILLLLDLGLSLPIATAACLPFLVHPALAEVVTWISSRKDLLAGIFVLLTLWRGRLVLRENRAIWPIWLFTALACFSKGSAVVLPLLAFLLWRPPFLPASGKIRFKVLLGGVTIICLLIALHQAVLASKAGVTGEPGLAAALPGTFLHYVSTLFWPSSLAVHYPLSVKEGFAQGAPIKALWYVLLLLSGIVLLLRGRGWLPLVGLGILFFFLALLPYNNWIPGTPNSAADRYLYLPAMGLAFLLGGLLTSLPAKRRVSVSLLLTSVLVLILGIATHRRSAAFHDSGALWAANLEIYPEDAVSLHNLALVRLESASYLEAGRDAALLTGLELLEHAANAAVHPSHELRSSKLLFRWKHRTGDFESSLDWGRHAVEVGNQLPRRGQALAIESRLELAGALLSTQHYEEALELLNESEALYPDESEFAALHAFLLLDTARAADQDAFRDEARQREAKIRHSLVPGPWLALLRARILQEDGKNLEALKMLGSLEKRPEARGRDPYLTEALHLLLARLYLSSGNPAGAVAELKKGLTRVPISVRLRLRLAPLLATLSRYEEAEGHLRSARRIQPSPDLDRALAVALIGRVRGMVDKAKVEDYARLVEEAASLAPDLPEVKWLQGRVLWGRKDRQGALGLVRTAHRASPGDEQISRDYLTLLKAAGYAQLLAKREKEALRAFRELLDNTPPSMREDEKFIQDLMQEHFERRVKSAAKALLAQHFEEAIDLYEAALEILPDEVGARFELGCAWLAKAETKAGDDDLLQAERSFRRALREAEESDQDPAWMVHYLALTLRQQKRDPEARELLERYLEGVKKSLIRDQRIKERMEKLLKTILD